VTTEGEEDVEGMPRQVGADAVPWHVVAVMNVVEERVARVGPEVAMPAIVTRMAVIMWPVAVRGRPPVTPWRIRATNVTVAIVVTAAGPAIADDVPIDGCVAAQNLGLALSSAVGVRVAGCGEWRTCQGGGDERRGNECVLQHRKSSCWRW